MSCYACMRKYGIFCKESGCANCGYSFCLKCLKKEIEVPRRNNEKQKVCLRCYETLKSSVTSIASNDSVSSPIKRNTKIEPNEIFQITDPIISLGPVLEPISSNSIASPNVNSDEITDNLDLEIQRRLKGLKRNGDDTTDDENLRLRLSNLQGFKLKEYSKKDILSTDQRSEQEKINDLLKQFVEEKDIESNVEGCKLDPISDIERRLAALRDSDPLDSSKKPTLDANTPSDNEEDDETMLKNIIQRYVDEARLPTASGSDVLLTENQLQPVQVAPSTNSTEELPWCTICNEDAVLRCQSCDGDLFCRNCFKECHQDDEEWRDHITQPYSKPPTFKEDHF